MDVSGAGGEFVGLGFLLVIFLIGAACLGLWIWSIVHCITNKRLTDTNRIIGIVLIVVLGLLGSLIYLFLPRESEAFADPGSHAPRGP